MPLADSYLAQRPTLFFCVLAISASISLISAASKVILTDGICICWMRHLHRQGWKTNCKSQWKPHWCTTMDIFIISAYFPQSPCLRLSREDCLSPTICVAIKASIWKIFLALATLFKSEGNPIPDACPKELTESYLRRTEMHPSNSAGKMVRSSSYWEWYAWRIEARQSTMLWSLLTPWLASPKPDDTDTSARFAEEACHRGLRYSTRFAGMSCRTKQL